MSYRVRVPATTANLGPGFDCLGLALDIWNELEVSFFREDLRIEIEGEGEKILPRDAANSIYRSMQAVADHFGKPLPTGLSLHCVNRIPLGSGLGSSSAAIVAGIYAGYALLNQPIHQEQILNLAATLEGHPDNVAPCIYGGLVASMNEIGQFISRPLPIAPLSLVIVTPEFVFPTSQARAALPKEILLADAVYNLSHSALLIQALASGDLALLALAMKDRLHQPYRLPLIPGAIAALEAAQSAGAVASALSGAGSSLLAILKSEAESPKVIEAMQSAFKHAGLDSRAFSPSIAFSGATLNTL